MEEKKKYPSSKSSHPSGKYTKKVSLLGMGLLVEDQSESPGHCIRNVKRRINPARRRRTREASIGETFYS